MLLVIFKLSYLKCVVFCLLVPAPINVDVTNVGKSSSVVTWEMRNASIDKIEFIEVEIQRQDGGDKSFILVPAFQSGGMASLTGLQSGTVYKIRLRAVTFDKRMSEWTSEKSFATG